MHTFGINEWIYTWEHVEVPKFVYIQTIDEEEEEFAHIIYSINLLMYVAYKQNYYRTRS